MNIKRKSINAVICGAVLLLATPVLAVGNNSKVYAHKQLTDASSESLLDVFQQQVGIDSVITDPAMNFFAQGLTYAQQQNEQNNAKALSWFLRSAELGYAPAQYIVGKHFEAGVATKQDVAMAIEWYRKAAQQDLDAAKFSLAILLLKKPETVPEAVALLSSAGSYLPALAALGRVYDEGVKVPRNADLAEQYYLKAANGGHSHAMFLLSGFYAKRTEGWQDKDAMFWLDKSISLGHLKAITQAAYIHEFGLQGSINIPKAMQLYQLAAVEDEPVALNNLGLFYLQGKWVKQNYELAAKLFYRAAHQGFFEGYYHLGVMSEHGYGAAADLDAAHAFYLLAATNGYVLAQRALGFKYKNGQGVTQDLSQSAEWFRLAAEANDAVAQFQLGDAYERGLGVPEDINLAVHWYKLGASNGDWDAQFSLAWQYEFGRGVKQNYQLAQKYYRLAAEQNHMSAMYRLGELLRKGQGSDFEFEQAFYWINRSAEVGSAEAQLRLGEFYHDGMTVPQDYTRALYWFNKAAAGGESYAMYRAASMYLAGAGTEVDEAKALSLALAAAEHNERGGNYLAGRMYYKGWGGAVNNELAIQYLSRAIELGYNNARAELDALLMAKKDKN